MLGIDFHRVFHFWAQAAEVDASRFYDQWKLDEAYKEHEVGSRDFHAYTQHLGTTLNVFNEPSSMAGWVERPVDRTASTGSRSFPGAKRALSPLRFQ